MMDVTMRPYKGEADLQAIVDLLDACEAIDHLDDGSSVDELWLELTHPQFDLAHDLRLWEKVDGALIAFGQMEAPDAFLWFKVHPDTRGGDLESRIIAWGEERMREIAQARGIRAELCSWAHDTDTDRMTLLRQHGFTVGRYFLSLERPLDEPLPELLLPQGFTVRSVAKHEVEMWVALYNEAFVDHWKHIPWTVETYQYWLTDPHYRPELNLVAVAPDGTLAAFCWCDINPEENARNERDEGWVSLLGTRPSFRQMGLGRIMLLSAMQRLRTAGVVTAKLNVDAENLTGATRLYESVGFRMRFAWLLHCKDLSGAPSAADEQRGQPLLSAWANEPL